MKKLALNIEELSVDTFEVSLKADGAVGVITVLDSCSCLVDCRTATVGRCCPP